MYGARGGRPVQAREGIPVPHYTMMPRKPVYSGGNDNNSRSSRGKAVVDEDNRLGSSRGGDLRVPHFSGAGGKSRGNVEQTDRHRVDNFSHYSALTERKGFRDDSTVWKIVAGAAEEAPLRAEGGGRFRDGLTSRGDRIIRPAGYSDDAKLVRNGNYDALSYDGVAGSLRDIDYLPVTKSFSTTRATLPGFIFECSKRSILEFFSSPKGSFVLPLEDGRFGEQVGSTTKIFMFDRVARELHGVFQAEAYSSPLRVRVRVAKECIPLTERQFKEILHDNYYTSIDFTENLTKEQVMMLLHTFRPLDPARSVHVSLPASRRISDSGLSHSSQDFHSVSDEIAYRKGERWRRGTVDNRSHNGHSYISEELTRFKLPVSSLPAKSLDEFEDYADDEGIEDLPVSTSRLTIGSSPYFISRGREHSLRSLSGSRTSVGHLVGNVSHSELKLADANWREDMDPRDVLYRKRQALSPSPVEELKRGDLSASPPWKDVHPMVEESVEEIYDRQGKGVYKEESSSLSSRRRRHNDIDLNIPLEMGHGEPAHLHDVKSKGVRRRVWDDDKEEETGYSVSPQKDSLLLGSALQIIPDHLLSPEAAGDYDDSRLDSRHMVSASRKEYPLLRTEEKGRSASNSFSNRKFGNPQPRTVSMKSYSKDKPVPNPIIRKRPDLSYSKEPTLRGAKAAVFQIEANLETPEGGRPGRVVRMVNERIVTMVDSFRSRGDEGLGNGGSISQGRKRKASVWSRITLPGKGPGQKGPGPQARGRVFSRLGPTVGGSSFEWRDDTYGYKNKKPRPQQTETEIEAYSDIFDGNVGNSPDALEGEDYLKDDHDAEESNKEIEKAADDLQGWTRKKASMIHSGDESGVPDHAEFANTKGGRRKLVRPSIGAPTLTADDVEETRAQLRSLSGSMDRDMANKEAYEAGNKSPRGTRQDLNSLAEDSS